MTNAAQQPSTVRTGHLARGGWGGRGQGHGRQPMKAESRYQTKSWEGHALQEVELQIGGGKLEPVVGGRRLGQGGGWFINVSNLEGDDCTDGIRLQAGAS